jgi:hypothetical protein
MIWVHVPYDMLDAALAQLVLRISKHSSTGAAIVVPTTKRGELLQFTKHGFNRGTK